MVLLAGCDNRPPIGAADATSATDGTRDQGVGADTGNAPDQMLTPPNPPSAGACVVGIRVDNCCTAAMPVPLADVERDECLVRWSNRYPVPEVCRKRWPARCALVDCASIEPPSRVAARVNGTCQFADECQGPNGCVIGRNSSACCGCPEVLPRALLTTHPCLLESGSSAKPPQSCFTDCPDMMCAPCGTPVGVQCVLGDALNRCQASASAP